MDLVRLCLTVIIAIPLLLTLSSVQIDALEGISDDMLDGSVSDIGCLSIGGNVTIQTMQSGEIIPICEYRDKHLSIFDPYVNGGGCFAAEVVWIDPESGESFSIPSANCDVPKMKSDAFCDDAAYSREPDGATTHYLKNVTVDDVTFPVYLDTSSVGCYGLSVRQETKDMLLILLSNNLDENRAFSISFPTMLLKGNYTVLVDGRPTNVSVIQRDSTVTLANITLPVNFDGGININRVQIIGTEVIPEFSEIFTILSIGLGIIAVCTRMKK